MLHAFILPLLFLPIFSLAQVLDAKEFPWVKPLQDSHVQSVHVCGDADIQPTKKSLWKDFLLGPKRQGLLLSGILSKDEYFAILDQENLESAKSTFTSRFQRAHLWSVGENGETKDLGAPAVIELPFVATVKDCMEGAKTSLGNDCSIRPVESRATCCQEKFAGPRLKWREGESEYTLLFSPDPSVRLKVPGEKKHRYCDVQRKLKL